MRNYLYAIIYLVAFCFSITFATTNSNLQPTQKITKQTLIQLMRKEDTDHAISPDGKWFVYIKESNFIVPSDCYAFILSRGDHSNEIWIVDLKTLENRLLVSSHFSCDDPTKVILDPNNLQFSPDSKTLYFAGGAWVVSGAIHAVNINGKNLRFVADGNGYQVITQGPYKGDLIINQHRYRFQGDTPMGSYDWDWLFTPAGRQIKLYKKED